MSLRPQNRGPGAVQGSAGADSGAGRPVGSPRGRARGRPGPRSLRNSPLERPRSRGCVCARAPEPRARDPRMWRRGRGSPRLALQGRARRLHPGRGVCTGGAGEEDEPRVPRRPGGWASCGVHREPAVGVETRREEPWPVTHECAPGELPGSAAVARGAPWAGSSPAARPGRSSCCSPGAPARARSPSRSSFPVSGGRTTLCPRPESWKPAFLRGGVWAVPRLGL